MVMVMFDCPFLIVMAIRNMLGVGCLCKCKCGCLGFLLKVCVDEGAQCSIWCCEMIPLSRDVV